MVRLGRVYCRRYDLRLSGCSLSGARGSLFDLTDRCGRRRYDPDCPDGGRFTPDGRAGSFLCICDFHRFRPARPICSGTVDRPPDRAAGDGNLSCVRHQLADGNAAAGRHIDRGRLPADGQSFAAFRWHRVLYRSVDRADGPLPRRLRENRGNGVRDVRIHIRQCGVECGLDRRNHHPADARRRLPRAFRCGDRGRGVDRRPVDAAGDGCGSLPDGRVS